MQTVYSSNVMYILNTCLHSMFDELQFATINPHNLHLLVLLPVRYSNNLFEK